MQVWAYLLQWGPDIGPQYLKFCLCRNNKLCQVNHRRYVSSLVHGFSLFSFLPSHAIIKDLGTEQSSHKYWQNWVRRNLIERIYYTIHVCVLSSLKHPGFLHSAWDLLSSSQEEWWQNEESRECSRTLWSSRGGRWVYSNELTAWSWGGSQQQSTSTSC